MSDAVVQPWPLGGHGVIEFPSGRRLRGRSLRRVVDGDPPQFGLYLGRARRNPGWEHVLVPWRDFGLPSDAEQFSAVVVDAWQRSATQRVEVVCGGGRGRTGTALACIAIIDGVDPVDAVDFVRANYHPRAVETPWQRRFVRRWR